MSNYVLKYNKKDYRIRKKIKTLTISADSEEILYQDRHHNVFPQVRFHLLVGEFFSMFFLIHVCMSPSIFFFFFAMMNKYLIAITAQW